MDDECVIRRPAEGGVDDDELVEATGELEPVGTPKIVYEGKCKVTPTGALAEHAQELGGVHWSVKDYMLSIPADSPMPRKNDEVEITASRRDLELVNSRFRVREVLKSSFLVSRRMLVEDRS